MKTRMLIGFILCCLCMSVKAETETSDPTSIILARYRAMLVEGEVPDAETKGWDAEDGQRARI